MRTFFLSSLILPGLILAGCNQSDQAIRVSSVPKQPAPVMQAQLITCTAPGAARSVTLFETSVAPLVNAPQPAAFVF